MSLISLSLSFSAGDFDTTQDKIVYLLLWSRIFSDGLPSLFEGCLKASYIGLPVMRIEPKPHGVQLITATR